MTSRCARPCLQGCPGRPETLLLAFQTQRSGCYGSELSHNMTRQHLSHPRQQPAFDHRSNPPHSTITCLLRKFKQMMIVEERITAASCLSPRTAWYHLVLEQDCQCAAEYSRKHFLGGFSAASACQVVVFPLTSRAAVRQFKELEIPCAPVRTCPAATLQSVR